MYKILFTSATNLELKKVKSIIKKENFKTKIDFFCLGVGNYKTILNLTKFLTEKKYDFVVNIGICGFTKEKNPIQIARILNYGNDKEILVPIYLKFLELKSILSSEKIIYDEKNMGKEKYVDMESYGFEIVCDNFIIPRIILKIPFDKIGSQKTRNYKKEEIEKLLENIDYKKLIKKIIDFLEENKEKNINLEKYEKYFKFSFSEKIIFKKLYFKYETLIGETFKNFFKENKNLSKKEFLKKLENIKK